MGSTPKFTGTNSALFVLECSGKETAVSTECGDQTFAERAASDQNSHESN